MEERAIYKQLIHLLNFISNSWMISRKITNKRSSKFNLASEATRQESKSALENTTRVILTTSLNCLLDLLLNEDGLEFREEVVFPDGAVYKGQLRVDYDMRHGFGIQVWPDGAKYEGNWRNNVASGRGKFHHIDGDIYDGMLDYC